MAIVLIPMMLHARTITVTTTNNISPEPGETNLVQAINLLRDGDSIAFNISGTGPFYLITPPLLSNNGYPAITNNNITIDGYSERGAFPNTNTILGSNTAQIQIILDSHVGGLHVEDIPGLSLKEGSVLLIKGATNVTLRGLDFLGPGVGSGTTDAPATYAISFASSMNGHVNGCWFGVAPDRTNVFRFQDAITGFQGSDFSDGIVVGVEKSASDVATARSQFNVIVGEYIPIILEGENFRISGNFINVFPDGTNDYLSDGSENHDLQAFMEFGGSSDNLVIGTDGDGNNDAEERNIFGGVTLCDDFNLFEWYGSPDDKDMVIAGNYFGVGVDGLTRFTNSMTFIGGPHGGLHSSATLRIGSDGDGVSDDLEGNVISMNYPFDEIFPNPPSSNPYDFSIVQSGACISFRGNKILGAQLAPFTYADGFGDDLSKLASYCSNYFSAPYFPTLSTNSTQTLLRGTVPPGIQSFTNIVLDVYRADDEAWTNGQKFQFSELAYIDPGTSETAYYGFAEGRAWLASFDLNGPANLDPVPGQFAFDISTLNIPASALVTISASYTTNVIGTHNPVMHTSPFALPVMLQTIPRLSIAVAGTDISLAWPTNAGTFTIQTTRTLSSPAWQNLTSQPPLQVIGSNYQAEFSSSSTAAFFRLIR